MKHRFLSHLAFVANEKALRKEASLSWFVLFFCGWLQFCKEYLFSARYLEMKGVFVRT